MPSKTIPVQTQPKPIEGVEVLYDLDLLTIP